MGRGERLGGNRAGGGGEEEEDVGRSDGRLLNAFMKNRFEDHLEWDESNAAADEAAATVDPAAAAAAASPSGAGAIPMMRSKDTVNQFLKAAATRQLTSIEENSGGEQPQHSFAAAAAAAIIPVPAEYSSSKPPLPPRSHPRRHLGPSAKADAPHSSSSVRKYPDLNFLENDVGLWDAFFMHGKNSSKFPSVLRHPQQPPPPPPHAVAPAASADYSTSSATAASAMRHPHQRQKRNSIPAVLDSESLRTLLPPSAHKHLLADETDGSGGGRASPITQVCQSMSRLTSKNDLENEAIKSMFGQQQQQRLHVKGEDGVKVVRVKEAWAEVPAREQVVMRRARKEKDERNMNLINNNDSQQQQQRQQDSGTKRRSYHPQDYLSQVLVQEGEGEPRHRGRRRGGTVPKVKNCAARSPYGARARVASAALLPSRDTPLTALFLSLLFSPAVRTTSVIPGLQRSWRRRRRGGPRGPASPPRAGRRETPRSPPQSTRSTPTCACRRRASTLISRTREVSERSSSCSLRVVFGGKN